MIVSFSKCWLVLSVLCTSACSMQSSPEEVDSRSEVLSQVEMTHQPSADATAVNEEIITGIINIYGNFQAAPGGKANAYVYLFETEGRDYFLLDSAALKGNSFQFKDLQIESGIYKMGFSDNMNDLLDIILTPAEDSVTFVFATRDLKRSLKSTNSSQTNFWREYMMIKNQHEQFLDGIRKGSQPTDAKREAIYAKEAELKTAQMNLAAKNEGTFFAKVMRHQQSDYRFEKAQFWSDLDFRDPSLIHSTVYPDRIEDFMRLHGSKSPDPKDPTKGFYSAVDFIANNIITKGDSRVLEFVLYTMSEGFYSSGMEALSLYVVDNYFYGDACGDQEISELFKMKASGIQNLKTGAVAPDFSVKTNSGQVVNLTEVAAKNKYTLVFFWASFCHRCEREIPELKVLYDQKKNKGFDVLAVSVDTNEKDFKAGVSAQGTVWNNGSDFKGWRGQTAIDYRVTSTPVLFLLNNKREIVAKPKSVSELSNVLRSLAL